jgi:exosortase
LVPLIIAFLVWSGREDIFSQSTYSRSVSLSTGILSAFLTLLTFYVAAGLRPLLTVLSLLSWLIFLFVAFFGVGSVRKAVFPISLLLFMIPVPGRFVESVISFLQAQSADLSYRLFLFLGVPVLRDGFILTVPGVSIEVAKECSGINSSIALLILMIIFAHETLSTNWRRMLLVLLVVPLSIIKNAIRIVTLTMLAIRVDPSFLTGHLHHDGGFVFFLIALGLMYPIWKLLRVTDKQRTSSPASAQVAVSASHSSN